MTPLVGWLAAALLAGEPVGGDEVARELDEIFAHERYYFCAADNNFVPSPSDQRWCELAAQHDTSRCPGFARVCGHVLEVAEIELQPGESTDAESKSESSDPGEVNQIAHDDRERFQLPDLGGFAKLLMWIVLVGLAVGVIVAVVRNLVRGRSEKSPEPESEDAGESLVAARIEALRVVETDVQRLLARAEAAAARGDWAAGIADLHAAMLRRLEGARLIRLERWRTNGDYLRALRSRPELRDEVREVVREVEQVQFGASPANPERYADIRAAVLAIVSRTALVLALGLGLGAHTACDDDSHEASVSALAGLGTAPSEQRAVGELLLRFDIQAQHRSRDIEELAQTQGAIVLLADVELTQSDWQRLLEWVEHDGGVLIVATGLDFPREVGIDYMPGPELTTELTPVSSLHMFSGLDCEAPPGRTLSARAESKSSTNTVLARPAAQSFASLFDPTPTQTTDDGAYVLHRRKGSGQIFVFAESDMLTNAGLLVADNGACLVNLLRSADVEELEFVNSYTGGGADNPVDSVRKAKLGAVFVQTLLFLALLYAMVGLPFARLRDPPEQRRRAFVEHVRTLGQRYAQARAAHYVGVHYCTWALDRLRARLQPGSARGLHDLSVAVAARTGRPEAEVMQILVEAHELRESHVSAARGGSSELELMRRLSQLLTQIGFTPGGPG